MEGDFDRIARRQHSLVTTAQLRELGWTKSRIEHQRRTGRLLPVRPAVLRPVGAPATREQAWMAAVLAAGAGALLSHATAVALWRLVRFPDPDEIDVLVERRQRPRMPGVRGHRTQSLPPDHRTVFAGIPVTTVERTLVDACGLVTYRQLDESLDDAIRRRLTTIPRLTRTVDEVPVSGRRRIRPVAALLAERVPGYDPGGSKPEVDLVRLLTKAGFPKPDQQIRVRFGGRTYFVDAGWPELKVGYEYDSVAFHGLHGAVHRDRDRIRQLKWAGWDIWPITSRTTANEVLAIAAHSFGHQRTP